MAPLSYLVSSIEPTSGDAVVLSLAPAAGQTPLRFEAGQYAAISWFRAGRRTPERCFSIIAAPDGSGRLQFAIRVSGAFTRGVSRLRAGDRVMVRGPFGQFKLSGRVAPHTPVVMLAGGIGITPFVSLLRAAQLQGMQPGGAGRRLSLIWSVRRQADAPLAGEINRLTTALPGLTTRIWETQASGRLTPRHLERLVASQPGAVFMICGPSGFTAQSHNALLAAGVPAQRIITEAFSQQVSAAWPRALASATRKRRSLQLAVASLVIAATLVLARGGASAVQSLVSKTESAASVNQTDDAATTANANGAASSSNTASTQSSGSQTSTYQQPTSSVS